MRVTLPMALVVCVLCWAVNTLIPSMRPGGSGGPVCSTPAVTQAELDAAHAAREQRIRAEGLPRRK